MKITYLIPFGFVCGGLRVVFEQANRLQDRGHQVKIISLQEDQGWFPLKAEFVKVPCFEGHIPESDILIATFNTTARPAYESGKGIPFYLIQHYETLFYEDRDYKTQCEESYRLPLVHLYVSRWLKSLIEIKFGQKGYLISNGIDLNQFKPSNSLLSSPKKKVLMIYSPFGLKNCQNGILAFKLAKEKLPDLELIMFGTSPPPATDFVYTYFYNPPQENIPKIYSSSDCLIFPSLTEGFGLPPLEAMACGCPVITTDCGGVRDFAKDEETSLLVPPQKPEEMARAIIRLLTDESLRKKIFEKGLLTAKRFSWDKVIDRLERNFKKSLDR